MTNPKPRSFSKHLTGLLLLLALAPPLGGAALARTPVRKTVNRPTIVNRDSANAAVRDLMLVERPRRVNSLEPALSAELPWTSDVIYNTLPKLSSENAVAAQANGTIRVPVKLDTSLNSWPGLNFRARPATASTITSSAVAAGNDPKAFTIRMSDLVPSTTEPGIPGSPAGAPGQKGSGTVSTAPMTAGEKFTYFLKKSFLSPASYGLSIFGGMISEALDSHEHHSDAGGFIADGMTHAARSFAFRSTANFFEKFAYATMFKQDPRYHRSNNSGFGAKVGYAISRVFITQGDRGGRQFNAAFIVGGLSAAGLSNLWERDEHVNIGDTFVRWGEHVGFTALYNVLREFIGGQ